jgi:hypothetical protein
MNNIMYQIFPFIISDFVNQIQFDAFFVEKLKFVLQIG